ncbi:hypothetical protein WJ438_40155 [Streptomyces sp. GD-15H]|uniref:hypothetical protein n=1 Tax=Streptomyces sp. GD-15H TaxID=3129112 RepID=UPI003244A9CF
MDNASLHRRYVTAVPASERLRKEYPRVAGLLDVSDAEFMGEKWHVFTVHCKYKDGDDCPIEVSEEGIEEANPRRDPETVLPLPKSES